MNRARIMPNPQGDDLARFVGQRDYENISDVSGSAIYTFSTVQTNPHYVATFEPIEKAFNSGLVLALSWSYHLISNTLVADFYGLRVQQNIDSPTGIEERMVRATRIVGRRQALGETTTEKNVKLNGTQTQHYSNKKEAEQTWDRSLVMSMNSRFLGQGKEEILYEDADGF